MRLPDREVKMKNLPKTSRKGHHILPIFLRQLGQQGQLFFEPAQSAFKLIIWGGS